MGHSDNLKLGDWNALCDRCGFKFKASELKEEWTGWMVCKECWEPRHPQDFIRGIPDDSSVPWSRPDSNADTSATDVNGGSIETINSIQLVDDADVTLTAGSDHIICEYYTALTSNRTVTLDTGNLVFNGDFSTADTSSRGTGGTGWSWTAQPDTWEISGGKARHIGASIGGLFTTALGGGALNATAGTRYVLTYTIEDDDLRSTIGVQIGSESNDVDGVALPHTPGTYTRTVQAAANSTLLAFLSQSGASTAKIDNVRVVEEGGDSTIPDKGSRFTIYRTGGGAGTLNVGGLQTIPANVNGVVIVEFDGSTWQLIDYYTLGL